MNSAVIVAGGSGERFGDPGGKQLSRVAGLPMLSHTLLAFERADSVDEIVLVAHPERVDEFRREAVESAGVRKVSAVVPGGSSRQQSVEAGVAALSDEAEMVAVHDGARPLVRASVIEAAILALQAEPGIAGVVVGHRAVDTVKEVDPGGRILSTPDRASLWIAQTPQVFRIDVLRSALAAADSRGIEATDDAALVTLAGGRVVMLDSPRDNIKVTVAEDLAYVEWVLASRVEEGRS